MNRFESMGMAFLGIAFILVPSLASAVPREHDGGFFLRLSGGLATGKSSIDNVRAYEISDWEISGEGVDMNIAIGGIVMENLAIHGTLFGWSVRDPEVEIQSSAAENPFTLTAAGSFSFSGVGGGFTYYLMPVDVYLSGSAGIGVLSFEDANSDRGLGLEACAGKEWWVSDRWALGVAVGATYHRIGETDIDENWSGTSFGIRFTATLN